MLAISLVSFALGLIAGLQRSSLVLIPIAATEMVVILFVNWLGLHQLSFLSVMLVGMACLQAGYCLTVFGPILLPSAHTALPTSRRYR